MATKLDAFTLHSADCMASSNDGELRCRLVVPFRAGGPRNWGAALAGALRPDANIDIVNSWKTLPSLLSGHADLVHTTVPFVHSRHPLLATIKADFRLENPAYRSAYWRLMDRADAITVPSQAIADTLGINAQVIPNGVAIPRHLASEPPPYFRILVASNFAFAAKANAAAALITALASNQARWPGLQVDVVGGGAHTQQVRAAALRAGPAFSFLGWVPDLRERMADYSALAYWTGMDNQPNVVLEAMAAGLPVVANPIGDLPTMLPAGAIVDTLEKGIERLHSFQDPQTWRAASRAVSEAVKPYDWSSVRKIWIKLYRELAASV